MKTFKLFFLGMILIIANAVQGQVTVTARIGAPPLWGPAGYNAERYYYLPDVESYYDVHSSMFIYKNKGVWVHRAHLPSQYRNYDLYGGYKVVMKDYHGETPYTHFAEHQKQYGKGYRGEVQRTNGERFVRENPGVKQGGHNNGKGGKRGK
jgi:hypothetical protein